MIGVGMAMLVCLIVLGVSITAVLVQLVTAGAKWTLTEEERFLEEKYEEQEPLASPFWFVISAVAVACYVGLAHLFLY